MASESKGQPFVPTRSLWRLIESRISEHERLEVKTILGESIVDQTLELHEEIGLLLDIWQDYHNSTVKENSSIRLPEPPELRQRLGQEINFFVTALRERAAKNGRDPAKVLSKHNVEVIKYAVNVGSSSPKKPFPSKSVDGRQTPCVEPNTERLTRADILSEDLSDMSHKLNLFTFEDIVQNLRSELQREVLQLGEDIITLQTCLEDEADYREESSLTYRREPTLTELKEERSSLERDVMSAHPTLPTPPHTGPRPTPIHQHRSIDVMSAHPTLPTPPHTGPRPTAIHQDTSKSSKDTSIPKTSKPSTTQRPVHKNSPSKNTDSIKNSPSKTSEINNNNKIPVSSGYYVNSNSKKVSGDSSSNSDSVNKSSNISQAKYTNSDSHNTMKPSNISQASKSNIDSHNSMKPSNITQASYNNTDSYTSKKPNISQGFYASGDPQVSEAAKITLVDTGHGRPTVHVASINQSLMMPSPPATNRPSSAARFRRMVHNCREDS